jgi:uncharacterized membrane protein
MPADDSRLADGGSDSQPVSLRLDRAFALIALVFGTILVLLIPPFQSADEPAHFYRAYQISEGVFAARQEDGRGLRGAYLPASLYHIWLPFSGIGFHPSYKASVAVIRDTLKVPLEPQNRLFIAIANTAHYCPTCYLPQALGIILGRSLGATPLVMLYIGREANLLVWILLGAISLRIAPAISRPIFLLLLMPMTLWTAATLSADTPTNGLAILFVAWIAAQSAAGSGSAAKPIGFKSFAQSIAITVPLVLCKLVYTPLLGLLLLVPQSRFLNNRRWITIGAVLLINLAALAMWASTSENLDTRINASPSVSPRSQADYLQRNPGQLPGLIVQTIESRGWDYVRGFVGVIGWTDLYLPAGVVIGYLILLLIACLSTPRQAKLPPPGLTLALVLPTSLISAGMIAILSYLYWCPVGYSIIDGISGRYFIPLAPAILLLLCSLAPRLVRIRNLNLILAAISLCTSVYFVVIVWGRYFGWIDA